MNIYITSVALALLCLSVESNTIQPKVQVYTSHPGALDKPNTLICKVNDFHPPEITIELLKNGQVIPKTNQTDLSFGKSWQFHLSVFGEIIPAKDEKYACRVTHVGIPKTHEWESNM